MEMNVILDGKTLVSALVNMPLARCVVMGMISSVGWSTKCYGLGIIGSERMLHGLRTIPSARMFSSASKSASLWKITERPLPRFKAW